MCVFNIAEAYKFFVKSLCDRNESLVSSSEMSDWWWSLILWAHFDLHYWITYAHAFLIILEGTGLFCAWNNNMNDAASLS